MSGIMVPKARAEAPVGGGEFTFPEGSFIAEIEQVRTKPFPEWLAGRAGYASSEGEITSIQLGAITPTEGDGNVGNRKFFIDFTTRDGEVSVEAGPDIPEVSWQMQKSAALLTNLAQALGATDEVEMEGETYVVTTDGFLEQLKSGELSGSRVGFTTFHRKWTSKTAKNADGTSKSGTEVRVQEFFQAV